MEFYGLTITQKHMDEIQKVRDYSTKVDVYSCCIHTNMFLPT